jgi:integrase/recombinase XerD
MELEQYLKTRVAPGTAARYMREIDPFFLSLERKKSVSSDKANVSAAHPAVTATYQDIMEYIGERRKRYKNAATIGCVLQAIKHFYAYLVATGQRKDNPVKSIRLRGKQGRDIQLQDLFKTEELELLLDRKERYPLLRNRNLIITSLLIYQGLTNGDIKNLELKDIDLEKAIIYIKATRKTNQRTLKLHSNQIFWLMNYLSEDRSRLLKSKTDKLIISKLGTVETGEGINYVIETKKYLFPERKLNPKTIRQSVITNLLKNGKDLRLVQAFAGHKYPSATELYKQTEVEILKNQIMKCHPLG